MTRFDGMQNAFEGLRRLDAIASQGLPALVEDVPVITIEPDLQDIHVFQPENDAEIPSVIDSTRVITSANAYARKIEIPAPQAMVMQPLRQAANATIRVRTQLLDRMVNQAGEVMISRSRLEAEVGQLRVSLNDMTGNLTGFVSSCEISNCRLKPRCSCAWPWRRKRRPASIRLSSTALPVCRS